jgi:hypothetical protein
VNDLFRQLSGGDRRSIGRADDVARKISADPKLFSQTFEAVLSADPVVRMRAADAIEKATRQRPELLRPYKRTILKKIAAIRQQEVCWHVALMLPRLNLTATEKELAVSILLDFLEHKSSIVRTCAMQGLADLAMENAQLRKRVLPLLQSLTESGTAAMRARGRKLLARFKPRPAQP